MISCSLRAACSIAALVLITAVTTGCGDDAAASRPGALNSASVERLAAASTNQQAASAPTVKCPKRLSSAAGAISWCTATFDLDSGTLVERVRVTARGAGRTPSIRIIAKAKGSTFEQVVADIGAKRGITLTDVGCPREVERIKGDTFTCTALNEGTRYLIELRHTNWEGSVEITSLDPVGTDA